MNHRLSEKIVNHPKKKAAYDLKEEAALATLLNTFVGIYNLVESKLGRYPSHVEYILRINHAGRKYMLVEVGDISDNNIPIVKRALWPKILERAHKYSAEIYNKHWNDTGDVRPRDFFIWSVISMVYS